tara:strand:+ start:118 stop:414 length:297 start_codon:yes stop_codon:yes gene_type:complete
MKLNEYIFKEMIKIQNARPADRSQMWPSGIYFTKNEVEKWIVEWYMNTFKKVGCDGELDDKYEGETTRLPPMWLANWRKVMEPVRDITEQERCGIDEG